MRQYGIDLIKRINDLCTMYKRYLSICFDAKLNVLIENNSISLKLYRDIEIIDEFGMSFDNKEKDIYLCLCVTILNLLCDENKIFNGHNVIYNRLDAANISIFVLDEEVLDTMMMMITSKDANNVYNTVCNSLNWRLYPRKIMKTLDERINISRKLIRLDDTI